MAGLLASMPVSYRDPLYAQLARTAEAKLGLPTGILDAIRTRGERSNADQVSSSNARTPYQFIPSTRQGFIRQYGIDPWRDASSATEAAAIHLRDDYKRAGSWNEAIARYHGGQHPGRASYKYASRVGKFNGEPEMAQGQSMYPAPYYGGADPLAPMAAGTYTPLMPESIKDTVPVPGSPGPSAPMPAAAPVAAHKRGGILGALESVFMPDADSRWAAALRGGIFDAKANQAAYKSGVYNDQLKTAEAEAKLKNLLTKGEFQIVGNNVFHIKPDGSTEMITTPRTPSEHETLLEKWRTMSNDDPAKNLVERMLLGASSDEVLQSHERQASTRAGATVKSARIRAATPSKTTQKPPAGFILDQ